MNDHILHTLYYRFLFYPLTAAAFQLPAEHTPPTPTVTAHFSPLKRLVEPMQLRCVRPRAPAAAPPTHALPQNQNTNLNLLSWALVVINVKLEHLITPSWFVCLIPASLMFVVSVFYWSASESRAALLWRLPVLWARGILRLFSDFRGAELKRFCMCGAVNSGLDVHICKIVLHAVRLLCIFVWTGVCICEPFKVTHKSLYTIVNLTLCSWIIS